MQTGKLGQTNAAERDRQNIEGDRRCLSGKFSMARYPIPGPDILPIPPECIQVRRDVSR